MADQQQGNPGARSQARRGSEAAGVPRQAGGVGAERGGD